MSTPEKFEATLSSLKLIEIEAALEFMALNYTKEDHVACYKSQYQERAAKDWDEARELVRQFRTVSKALNYVNHLKNRYR